MSIEYRTLSDDDKRNAIMRQLQPLEAEHQRLAVAVKAPITDGPRGDRVAKMQASQERLENLEEKINMLHKDLDSIGGNDD